jgi:hypothetical protein
VCYGIIYLIFITPPGIKILLPISLTLTADLRSLFTSYRSSRAPPISVLFEWGESHRAGGRSLQAASPPLVPADSIVPFLSFQLELLGPLSLEPLWLSADEIQVANPLIPRFS